MTLLSVQLKSIERIYQECPQNQHYCYEILNYYKNNIPSFVFPIFKNEEKLLSLG